MSYYNSFIINYDNNPFINLDNIIHFTIELIKTHVFLYLIVQIDDN